MKTRILLLTISFFIAVHMMAQWNPDAGLVKPYTQLAEITCSSGNNLINVSDGNIHTFWESSNLLPDNYINNKEFNIFLNNDKYNINISEIQNFVDGSQATFSHISDKNIIIRFNKSVKISLFSIKLVTPDSVMMIINTANGKQYHTITSSQNYQLIEIHPESRDNILSIELKSKNEYDLYEIAGLFSPPREFVLFDLKKSADIGWITSRHYNGEGVSEIKVYLSENKVIWKPVANLNPLNTTPVSLLITPSVKARYIKVEFILKQRNYQKAALHEFAAYDKYGPYGKPPQARPSEHTWSESFGINGFWGWGYNTSSANLSNDQGPAVFSKVAHLARNYHNMDWDIIAPGDNPDYSNMANGNGTMAKDWLNWFTEYYTWKKAGFTIDAAILFNNQYFPDTLWTTPYSEAQSYGKHFGKFFITDENLINNVEIGNEPWGYSLNTYQNILAGMSSGIRESSTNATILPCATQAYNKYTDHNNYISRYITQENSGNLNGLVAHTYSYIFNSESKLIAVNPEDRRSELWSVGNMQRFSAANLDNIPVYVTEFGYDSKGGSENCTHSVCITEAEQAMYGTRMALILYRLGVREFYWYFYANTGASIMHNRSGLTSSHEKGVEKKLAYYAFEKIQEEIGDLYFKSIIEENDNVYAYSFADKQGKVKKIIIWKPTSESHMDQTWEEIPFTWDITSAEYLVETKEHKTPSYVRGTHSLKIAISGNPVVMEVIGD